MKTGLSTNAGSDLTHATRTVALRSEKILPCHLERLAVVYIRQSSPQQVQRHRESREVQYGLKERAIDFGWDRDRVLVIDEDLGKSGTSATNRQGFQRLVTEVSLDHVGVIFGFQMSRIARSCADWYQLLEVCGLFRTLIGDLDGVYAPYEYNDRLLLGLKGAMSEAEIHILTQRMLEARIKKAERCELFSLVPIGYVRLSSGEVALDPDEGVQNVVRLVFRKFDELGTINGVLRHFAKNGIKIGVRHHWGPNRGNVEWREPYRELIGSMLRHPMYAGAYVHGRRQVDPRRKKPGSRASGRVVLDMGKWKVLKRDRLPAYITWKQYESNLKRVDANRSHAESRGAPREGVALLAGLTKCGQCGRRMTVQYFTNSYRYVCCRAKADLGGSLCQSLTGKPLDTAVEKLILRALDPAALELSLEAAANIERERKETHHLWQQKIERAEFEADRARRQYDLCEPENRLVARQLEKAWEEKLQELKLLREEYNRFCLEKPPQLSSRELEAIRRAAADISSLWTGDAFPIKTKKLIARELIESVVVKVIDDSEKVEVVITWAGGHQSELQLIRPVAHLSQLTTYNSIVTRVRTLSAEGVTAREIADTLNEEGFTPPRRRNPFDWQSVTALMRREGIESPRRRSKKEDPLVRQLKPNEWTAISLARTLDMPRNTVYSWHRKGLIKGRVVEVGRMRRLIVWADKDDIKRLRSLRSLPLDKVARQNWPGARGEPVSEKEDL